MIKDFFKKLFFFRIDKDEKDLIRERVMKNDHRVYNIILPIILLLESVVFVVTFSRNPTFNGLTWKETAYLGLYLFLIVVCIVSLIVSNALYKKNKPLAYFTVVSLTMFAIMLWGAGISLLDSTKFADYTFLAIGLIATSAFITIEPWVVTACALVSGSAYILLFCFLPGVEAKVSLNFFLTTAVIVGIAFISGTFNFSRRISAIRLELQVSSLNVSLSEKAFIDDLTKVHNRRYLTEHIDEPLDYGNLGSGVMMVDIDHFKRINDTYGHQVGDECLSLLGIAINNLIRGKKAYCVRYGGEEFLIYFQNITKEDLFDVAETFRKRIEKMKVSISGGVQISYTVSAGLAKAMDGISYNNLINEADEALYKAKETRNRVCFL